MTKELYDDCPGYLRDFLTYVRVVKDRGLRTEHAYFIDIRVFLRYLKIRNGLGKAADFDNMSVKDVPLSLVAELSLTNAYEYLHWLSDERGNSAAARSRKVSALRQFYSFLANKAELIPADPVARLEVAHREKTLPRFLTAEQARRLLEAVKPTGDRAGSLEQCARDKCILTLFLGCGMRLSELCGIDLGDLSLTQGTLRLRGKGRKERIVYLNESCTRAIEGHLAYRGAVKSDSLALFLSNRHTRLSQRRVEEIVDKYVTLSGLGNEGVSPHKLRHTSATAMAEMGVDTLVIKNVLGHESVATTEIYTHLSSERARDAAKALDKAFSGDD